MVLMNGTEGFQFFVTGNKSHIYTCETHKTLDSVTNGGKLRSYLGRGEKEIRIKSSTLRISASVPHTRTCS